MANYPSAISTNGNLYVAVNGLQTTLALACTNVATTLTLTSTTGFPTTGLVTIDNSEVVSYTGVSGATLTGCTRGADGTTAASHPIGVTVGLTVVAAHHNLLKDEIIAIETALGVNLANVFPATATTGTGNVVLQTSPTINTPTINSPTLVTPALGTPASGVMTNVTGLPLTTGVTGILPNANTTATPNATASTIMSRDASVNVKVNEMIENFTTTVTAAGTTTLTVTSSPLQQFTGTTTQTVTLPDATTLAVGFYFTILNRSTGAVTVNKNGGTLQATVPASSQSTFVCTSVGSAAGTWDTSTSSAGGITAYREDYVVGTALNNYTGSLTVFNLVTPYSVGGHSLVVTLDGDVQTLGATVDYQETNSTTVTFVNSLVSGEKVSFIFQTATSSGGTVNSGTSGQAAYYPATGPTLSGTSTPTDVPVIGLGALNILNIVDNGGFEIWQRGTSFSNPANSAYTADRWVAAYGGGTPTATVSQESSTVDTGLYSFKYVLTALNSASIVVFKQFIENYADYRGRVLTLSIRIKSSVANSINIRITDDAGSTDSSTNVGTNFETLTVTRTISSSTTSLNIEFGMRSVAAQVVTFFADSAMLVLGSLAGTFVPTNTQVDLARCKRFYQQYVDVVSSALLAFELSTTGAQVYFTPQVPFRVAPTATLSTTGMLMSGAHGNVSVSTLTAAVLQANCIRIDITTAGSLVAGYAACLANNSTSGYIKLSADL